MSALRKAIGKTLVRLVGNLVILVLITCSCTNRAGLSGAWEERNWVKDKWHFSMLEFHDDGTYLMIWAPAMSVECGTPLFQRGRIDTSNGILNMRSDFTFDTLRWGYSVIGDSLVLTGMGEVRILERTDSWTED